MSKLTVYHPNAKGTGSALSVELHPAHDEVEGSIFVKLMPQKTVGQYENGVSTLPTFDTDKAISVRLSAVEVARVLEVLRGYCESIDDGRGLFHRTATANTIVNFSHRVEPTTCYVLEISRRPNNGELVRYNIFLTMPESIMLSEALNASMVYLAFGVPSIG